MHRMITMHGRPRQTDRHMDEHLGISATIVLTNATRAKTDETENGPISQGSQLGVSMVRDLWWSGFTKKDISFEFRVKE